MTDAPTDALPCAEKLAFDTARQAQAAATVALHQHGTKLQIYVCQHCALWHLASV
ncbi:MAG: hypothetical protein JWN82_140 [Candidatus Saccharibacteria bacterium]|nr:hypothetical protein [Candidatus Saccharibacteria bacterium]